MRFNNSTGELYPVKPLRIIPSFSNHYIGPLAIDTKLDDTHYLLKDVTGRTLPGDYHINRIKRAKEVTPDGLADTYEQLQTQIGLPNDACATPQKNGAAQLRIK